MEDTHSFPSPFAGRYELLRELGRGGMAVVYLARDLKQRREVAIKVLREELALGDKARKRFLREIEIAAQLQHPNILPLFDSGDYLGRLYYVMPYVEGNSLRDRLERQRQLPVAEAVRIAGEAAAGLAYAHAKGVVHRDIKPGNILFVAGQAVIADFGIARALFKSGSDRVTETDVAIGTAAYMSPEQATAERHIDSRTDIYSLGCVLYEMLAGEPPFTGPTKQAIVARHMLEAPRSLSVVRPNVSRELVVAIEKALSKAPADRFDTAQEFAEKLEEAARSDRPASRFFQTIQRGGSRRARILRVLLLYLVSAAGVVQVLDILINRLGISEWLFAGAVMLFLAGFPVVFAGALLREQRIPIGSSLGRRAIWPNLGLTSLAAVAAWGLAFVLWPHVRPSPAFPPAAANRVVVFPLVEQGLASAPVGSGERVALRIGTALEQTDPVRFLWGWKWLTPRERADIRVLAAERADSIVRSRGARYYIDGSVAENPGGLSVTLALYDVVGDSLVMQRTERGGTNPDSLNQLGLSAMRALLPSLLEPGREFDPATYLDRDLAAEALWMQGEQLYRRSQFSPAYEFFRRAVETDSTLSMAALRGAQAANWKNMDAEAVELVAVALAGQNTLPERYADYSRGLQSYLLGYADSAVAQLDRALDANPEWSEVWAILGETYFHLLPGEGRRDSLAAEAFRAARRYDPDFTLPLFHLTEMALWSGDLDLAKASLRDFAAFQPDTGSLRHLTLMLECAEDGASRERWLEAAKGNPRAVLQAAASYARAGVFRRCAEQGFRAYVDAGTGTSVGSWDAMVGLTAVLAAEGRADEAAAVLDSAVASGFSTPNYLYVFSAAIGGGLEEQAASFVGSLTAEPSEETELNLWARGVWAVHTRDAFEVQRVAEELIRRAGVPNARRRTRLFADIMDVHAVLLAGDTVGAIDRLERLRPRGERPYLYWSLWYGIGFERLLFAQLMLERGQHARAYRVSEEFYRSAPVPYVAYLPRSLALQERAARALGWANLADRARDRLAELGRTDLLGS